MQAISHNPYASQTDLHGLVKGSQYSAIAWFDHFLAQVQLARRLDLLLQSANLDISVGFLLLSSLATGGIILVLASALFDQPFALALLIGALASSTPFLYVRSLAAKRLRRFLEQMPDGLDMMSQGLQAGLGLSQAQVYVAKEAPDPLGTEFSIFMEELNLGLPVREAIEGFQERMPIPEMRLFSTALLVQREVGGSLVELLTTLADVIRDRFRIEREIKTLTAQNRMAAWVVCSVPPLLTVLMFFMDPITMHEVIIHPVGRGMLIAALVLEILGILTFRRLLRLHI
jgi:tight adherence protein B